MTVGTPTAPASWGVTALFETMLPTRYYLPREDILAELVPSATRTYCAYKGQASYWSAGPET